MLIESLTGLVTVRAVTSAGLSTDFLITVCTRICAGLAGLATATGSGFRTGILDWAAARSGFTADLGCAGLADVAGLSADLAVVRGNATTDRAGTSRVSIFKLAS